MFRAFMSACVMSGLLAIAICSPVNGNCDGQELKEEKLKLKLVKALKRYQDSCLDKRIIGEKELNGTRDGSFVLAKGSNGLAAYRVASRHFADDLNRADGVIEIVVRENFIVKNNKLRMVSSGGLSESNRLEAVFLPSDHNFVGHLGDIAIALGVSPVDSLSFTELVESSKAVVKKSKSPQYSS